MVVVVVVKKKKCSGRNQIELGTLPQHLSGECTTSKVVAFDIVLHSSTVERDMAPDIPYNIHC